VINKKNQYWPAGLSVRQIIVWLVYCHLKILLTALQDSYSNPEKIPRRSEVSLVLSYLVFLNHHCCLTKVSIKNSRAALKR